MSIMENHLQELGIILPTASNPAAKYANYIEVNGIVYVSGKGPAGNPKGKLGGSYTTEEGYAFARSAGIEVLAVLHEAFGLDQFQRVIKVQGFVNAVADFEEHHKVLNGFSDLMTDVFAENGTHARSVFGANSVRDNLPIIVDSIFQLK